MIAVVHVCSINFYSIEVWEEGRSTAVLPGCSGG